MIRFLRELFGTLPSRSSVIGKQRRDERAVDEGGLRESEEHFAQLVSDVRDHAVFLLDRNGYVRTWNAGAERLKGYRADEIIGQHFSRFYTADSISSGWPAHELEVASQTGRFEDEGWRVRKDGSLFWANVVLTALRDGGGGVRGFLKITRDMTDRKQAEEKLRLSEERFRLLVDGTQDYAIFMLDLQGRVATWNAGAERLKGFKAAEIIGQHFSRFYPSDALQRGWPAEELRRAASDGRLEDEGWRVRKDGSLFWANVVITALRDEKGELRGFGKVTRDLTERKKAEENNRRLAQEEAARHVAEEAARLIEEQRERLRVTLSSIGDAVISTDAQGRVEFLNPVAEQLAGWPNAEANRRPLEEVFRIVNEDSRQCVENPALKALREHRVVGLANHTVLISKDGVERPISDTAAPIRAIDGEILGSVLVFRDVTEDRKRRHSLREETRLAETLNRVGLALAPEHDLPTIVQLVTDEATSLVGAQFGAFFYNVLSEQGESYTLYTLSGAPREAFDRFPMPRNTAVFEPTFKGLGVVRLDDVTQDPRYGKNAPYNGMPEGHLPVRSYLAVPVVSRTGEVLGGLFFGHAETAKFTDRQERLVVGIAAQAAVAIDNARLYAQLRETDRRKDEFLAMLAHELRNPLAPIRNALEVLKRPGADRGVTERIRALMERQVGHLIRLVDDLLDVSRVMRGKIELRKERIELRTVVDRAVETVQPIVDELGHDLSVFIGDGSNAVDADAVRLTQVIGNLLNNAAKYTEPGGRIWLRVERQGNEVVVSVKDSGIGIAPEHLSGVFDMFSQIGPVHERSKGGLGIGLTLVKVLVELHGGEVVARSAGKGAGSEFIVRLPLVSETTKGSEGSRDPATTGPDHERRRILVVDDNTDAAESLAILMQISGHDVQVAYNGTEALRLAETHPPTLAFFDLGMPEMDGYELARRFRRDPKLSRIRLVALTGWGQEGDRRRSRAAGFDDHLVKPVEPEDLYRVLGEKSTPKG